MKKIFKTLIILFCILILFSCASVGSFDGVMTMLVDKNNLKYYIRPEKMESSTKNSLSYLMIDFSYQMKNQEYVSDSYTNFTVYNLEIDFIKSADFIDINGKAISLCDITTLDRNAKVGYIRVTTILKKEYIQEVLIGLSHKTTKLRVIMNNGITLILTPTDELVEKINMAFDR